MRKLVVILVLLVVGFAGKSYGQDSTRHMVLKVDLLSPLVGLIQADLIGAKQSRQINYDFRVSTEIEFSVNKFPEWLTGVADLEFVSSEKTLLDSLLSSTHSTEIFPSFGTRIYLLQWGRFSGFYFQPSVSIGYFHYVLVPISGTTPFKYGNEIIISPRASTGLNFLIGSRAILSGSIEGFYRRFSIAPKRRFTVFPEINIGLLF